MEYEFNHFVNQFDVYKASMHDCNQAERKKHRPLVKTQKKNLEDIKTRIKVCKDQHGRTALYGEKKSDVIDPSNTEQLLSSTVDKSKDTTSSALRTLGMVEEMNKIGREANQKLETQNEQMQLTMENAMEIESELKRGRAIASRMLRRTAMDPVMWVLILFVLLAIVALIVMSIVNGDSTATDAVDINQLNWRHS